MESFIKEQQLIYVCIYATSRWHSSDHSMLYNFCS